MFLFSNDILNAFQEAEKYFATYTYDELKRKFPPEGVDVTKREVRKHENAKTIGILI